MKLPNSVHERHQWVISEIALDFRLLDVWALPAEGGPDEFDALLEGLAAFDPSESQSTVSRMLFAVRLLLGRVFGWDDPTEKRPIPGCTETTLEDRLPHELLGTATRPEMGSVIREVAGGFVPLYRTDDEWAAEISNDTVHGVVHLAWVAQGGDRYRGQMAVYVKPRGFAGEAYMKLIEPFRRFIVYPALMRQIARAWEARRR